MHTIILGYKSTKKLRIIHQEIKKVVTLHRLIYYHYNEENYIIAYMLVVFYVLSRCLGSNTVWKRYADHQGSS